MSAWITQLKLHDLPYYLQKKLVQIGINSLDELRKHNYLQVFQWLKYQFPSLGYQALYDLHSIHHNLSLSSSDLSKEEQKHVVAEYKKLLPSYPPLPQATLDTFLNAAYEVAAEAATQNEVPIGAVIVTVANHTQEKTETVGKNTRHSRDTDFIIIGSGYNSTLTHNDITAHAEIMAIKAAQITLNNHRLDNCDLYVTIEPCLMCMGAILHSRIRRVIFGAVEPKTGAVVSQYQVLNNKTVNHQTEAIGPIDNHLYARQIQAFMQQKR